jgi:hypothetical protein
MLVYKSVLAVSLGMVCGLSCLPALAQPLDPVVGGGQSHHGTCPEPGWYFCCACANSRQIEGFNPDFNQQSSPPTPSHIFDWCQTKCAGRWGGFSIAQGAHSKWYPGCSGGAGGGPQEGQVISCP